MKIHRSASIFVLATVLSANAAIAKEGEDGSKSRDHYFQGFANLLIGTGWFMVAPYDKNDPQKMCEVTPGTGGQEGEPVCTGRSGFHLDMLGGFGVLPGFEIAQEWAETIEPIEPNPANHERYMEYHRLYRRLYQHLAGDFQELARIRDWV